MKKHRIIILLWMTIWFTVTGCLETRPSGGNGQKDGQSATTTSSCQVPQTEDLEILANDLLPELKSRGNCSQEEIDSLERKVSELAVAKAKRLLQAGQDDEAEQLLRYPYTPSDSWEVQATLGEIAWRHQEWQNASTYFKKAKALWNDPKYSSIPPSSEEKQKIAKLLEDTRLITSSVDEILSDRDHPTTAVTPLPVKFEFGSDRFTPQGEESMKKLAEYLKKRPLAHITLVGHTDPTDTDSYNCRLSKRRVEAVKKQLIINGVNIKANLISTIAKGERDPYNPYEGRDSLPKKIIHQLDRRVEFSEGEISDPNACD